MESGAPAMKNLLFILTLSIICAGAFGSSESTTAAGRTDAPNFGVGCNSICCEGRNNTCHSTGFKLNGKGTVYSRCFCDEGCLDMGDCCFDYHTSCIAVDCLMSEWKDFSSCSSDCGYGMKTRERSILVKPKFGGTPCPTTLKESASCVGTFCNETKAETKKEIEKETAKIVRAKFGRYRGMKEYNANMDIRKNLFYRYYHKTISSYSGYCSRFRITASSNNCQSYMWPWANIMKKGEEICVDCQQTAMEKEQNHGKCVGHGEVGVSTHWNAINARGCTGWWERLEDNVECSCDESHSYIFI